MNPVLDLIQFLKGNRIRDNNQTRWPFDHWGGLIQTIDKTKRQQNKITLSNIETNKTNKWITFIYTANESFKLSNILRKDKNIKIAFKTNNKIHNIITKKIENQ